MGIVDEVLRHPLVAQRPPVLVDIGASARLNPRWRRIARHAVCVAFDADSRDFAYVAEEGSRFRQLHTFRCVASVANAATVPFHLTRSPYCSSTLRPDAEALRPWYYAGKFDVVSVAEVPARRLGDVLDELGLQRVDWFKTDSQGTDLSLFRSLGEAICSTVIIAEFEPGLRAFYEGEETFQAIDTALVDSGFWLASLHVDGSQRLRRDAHGGTLSKRRQRLVEVLHRRAPCWVEAEYFNTFRAAALGPRERLLGWVFATVRRHDGFALELARRGAREHADAQRDLPDLFRRMQAHSLRTLRRQWVHAPREIARRLVRRLVD